jgi:hypothetical protein
MDFLIYGIHDQFMSWQNLLRVLSVDMPTVAAMPFDLRTAFRHPYPRGRDIAGVFNLPPPEDPELRQAAIAGKAFPL